MKKLFLLLIIPAGFLHAQQTWTLQQTVDYAIQHNLQIHQTQYNQQTTENNLKIAKREYLPFVSGNINNTLSFGQGRDIFGTTQRNDNFNNNAGVQGDILLFNYGRLEKNIRKNEFDLEASTYDMEKIKNDISLQVAQQYLQILLNKEIEKIAQSALENAEKLHTRAKITTEVGTTPQTILAEASAALAREKQNAINAEINTRRSLFELAQLLRLEDYQNFDVVDVSVDQTPEAPLHSIESLLQTAYDNQPHIKAAESRIQAAEAQTEITRTAFWPTISAGAGIGSSYFNSLVTNTAGRDLYGNPILESGFFKQYKENFAQQVNLSANIPIFNKGITRLQVEQSKINEDIARTNLALQRQDVLQSVQRAKFDADSNYQIYLSAVEAAASSRLALDFAEKSFAAGRSTIFDVNIARNNYANAQGSVSQAKYNYLFSMKLLNFYAGIPISL